MHGAQRARSARDFTAPVAAISAVSLSLRVVQVLPDTLQLLASPWYQEPRSPAKGHRDKTPAAATTAGDCRTTLTLRDATQIGKASI